MTYEEEQRFEDAYRKANDYGYQERLIQNCSIAPYRRKYEDLLETPFKDRDCTVCRQCLCMDKKQMGKVTCEAKLKQKIKELS